ncbi:MAG: hypothetical protein RLQ12_18905 [Cyclobacteriaceae bacterium]
MKAETLKLGIIERLLRVEKTSTLQRMDQLITQAEIEARAEESLEAIRKGEVSSLDEFSQANRKWAKGNHTK